MNPTLLPPLTRALLALPALIALCAGLLLATPARAEEEVDDPPARVGRVSALVGTVETRHEPGAAWEPARLNQPVTGQTALWVPPGSQAEVRIGSTSVRLDGNTQAVFSQLDDHAIALDIAQGSARVRLRNLPTGDAFSLAADGVRADALQTGDYRVSHDPDRRVTTAVALEGRLRLVTPSNRVDVERGQQVLVEDGGASLQLRAAAARDDFDRWAEARDREQDRIASARYVSPETTGIEELDAHGRWHDDPAHGAVWYPHAVRPGWAPYRYGQWAWVRPWGWTWVDDAPWGFAPFHYGRWALIGSHWGWVPGAIVARPVWAPALVGYVGGSRGGLSLNIGLGFGAPIGWFPLAPYEIYHPPYRYSKRYHQHVNHGPRHDHGRHEDRRVRHHGQQDGHGYRYAQRPEALTVVREDGFSGSRPVGRERIQLTPEQAAQLRPVTAGGPARRDAEERPVATLPPPPAFVPRDAERRTPAPGTPQRGDRFERGDPEPRSGRGGRERDGMPRSAPVVPAPQAVTVAPAPRPPAPPAFDAPRPPRAEAPQARQPAGRGESWQRPPPPLRQAAPEPRFVPPAAAERAPRFPQIAPVIPPSSTSVIPRAAAPSFNRPESRAPSVRPQAATPQRFDRGGGRGDGGAGPRAQQRGAER